MNETYQDLEKKDEIVERVREKLLSRSQVGIKKYNTTLWENVHDNYIKHIQEELLDASNYCEQMLRLGEFVSKICKLIENEPNDKELGEAIRKEYSKLIQRR